MAINFTVGQFLTATALNRAFDSVLDLTNTGIQTMSGPLALKTITAGIAVTTQDLIVSGDAKFNSIGALKIPAGTTLQRPTAPLSGQIRLNTESGLPEIRLPSGVWANFVTQTAVSSPSNPPINQGAVGFGAASQTSIPLGWLAPGGGTAPFAYTVEYRPSGTLNWITWATDLSVTNTTVSGLFNATRFDFRVTSHNVSGQAISPVSSTSTLGFLAGGPTNLTAFNPTSVSMQLSWSPVPLTGPVGYVVRYAPVGQNTWIEFLPISSTIAVLALSPNTLYDFQVVAKTTGGSMPSLVTQGTTSPIATVPPVAVTNVTISNETASSFIVSWTPPLTGTAPFLYEVQLQQNGGAFIGVADIVGSVVTISSINSGQTYFVRIRAINSAGSATSTAVAATPLAANAPLGSVAGFTHSEIGKYPYITGPSIGTVGILSTINVVGLAVDDPYGAFEPGSMSISVACGAGAVTMTDRNGLKIAGSGTSLIPTTPGTLQDIQNALASVTYTAPATPTNDTITIVISDQVLQSAQITINMAVLQGSGVATPPPTPSPTPIPGGVTNTGQPTDSAGTQAGKMNAPLDALAIGVAFESVNYGPDYTPNSAAIIENMLNYTTRGHLKYLRAKVGAGIGGPTEQSFLSMVAQNVGNTRYMLALDVAGLAPTSWNGILQSLNTFVISFPQYCESVTGVYNISSTTYQAALNFQSSVYSTFHGAGLKVYPPIQRGTAITGTNADFGYYDGTALLNSGPDLSSQTNGGIIDFITASATSGVSHNLAATEFGWNTFLDTANPVAATSYVSETTQAAYLLTYIFRNYKRSAYLPGAASTNTSGRAIYTDLIDNGNKAGLFDNFYGAPRLAATSLRSIYNLYDNSINASSFTAGKLNYTVASQPAAPGGFPNAGYGDCLFQRADGSFVIIMWNEQSMNNSSTNAPLSVTPVSVTVTFNERIVNLVRVIDPMTTAGQAGTPYMTKASASNITFDIPGHPIAVIITP